LDNTNQINILTNNLFKPCAEGKTGTIYISTNNNKSCHIAITEGQIIASKMGRKKGLDAISEMNKIGVKGASFSEGMQLNYTNDSKIESSDTVLKVLGYKETKADVLDETDVSENDLDYSNIFDFLNDPEDISET